MKNWDNNDLLTGYLDNQGITEVQKSSIEQELTEATSDINIQRAVLSAVKRIVIKHQTVTAPVPERLRLSVLQTLDNEYKSIQPRPVSQKQKSESGTFGKLFDVIFGLVTKPIIAFPSILILLVGGYYYINNVNPETISGNFHEESIQNFDAIIAGKLKLQKATSSYAELDRFFSEQGVDYTILHPNVSATLAGGVVSVMNGRKLAHLVYKHQDKYIYVYQAPEEMFTKHVLHIPDRAVSYAESGKWLTESDQEHTWIFWREKTIYCSVVSDIPKEQLFSLFIKGV